MKQKVLVLLILFIIFTAISAMTSTIEHSYYFKAPQIISHDGYHIITMENFLSISKPGEPELPCRSVQLLLPPKEKAVNILVTYSSEKVIPGNYRIYPKQKQYPLSQQEEIVFIEPDPTIYDAYDAYPRTLHTDVQTQYARGHSIALLNIFPVRYIPASGKLSYFSEMNVTIETEPARESETSFNNFYRNDSKTKQTIEKIVDNPEQMKAYPVVAVSHTKTDNHTYVIITSSSDSSSFTSFANFKTKQGYNVLIKTTDEIYADPLYIGFDDQDEIRNFIKYAYQNFGTEYVLLGGDVEIVPHRGFWINTSNAEDYDIPADLYYAALDRVGSGSGPDWNVNNNNKWGETSEADYFAEVYIGRISADNTTEFFNALQKQLMYQQTPVANDIEKAIMVGERLNSDPLTWGGTYKDEVMNGSSNNGYTTTGFPLNFSVQTQYHRDGSWSWTDLKDKMNAGTHIINHLGHANPDYTMKFYRNYVINSNLTSNGINHHFYIIYTQGCYSASFDNRWSNGNYDTEDCIGEKFTTITNGCVAFIGNSRYGWYNPGGTDSGSQYLDRQFFDALFGEDLYTLGKMNQDSKEDGASQCNGDPWFRWSYYCVNLLGDPSLDVWTETPDTLQPTYVDSLCVTETQITIQTGISEALVGLSQNGEHIGAGITNGAGDVTIVFNNAPAEGTLDLYITAHNYLIFTGTITVFSIQPNFGTIEGTVTLAGSKANVQDVKVTADTITVHPDINGEYVITIYPGTYDVTASLAGYTSETVNDVIVNESQATTDVNLMLIPQPGWSVNPASYQYNGNITSAVFQNGNQISNAGDSIAAFCDGECRGTVGNLEFPPNSGEYIYFLTVYSNTTSGDTLTFKYWDALTGIIYDVSETLEFSSDMVHGTPLDPFHLTISAGNLQGYVTQYGTKAQIENAVVTISTYSDTTDAMGYYYIENIPEGIYNVLATAATFMDSTVTGISITQSNTTQVDFGLKWVEIAVNPDSLVFGSVHIGSDSTKQYTIQNAGTAELTG